MRTRVSVEIRPCAHVEIEPVAVDETTGEHDHSVVLNEQAFHDEQRRITTDVRRSAAGEKLLQAPRLGRDSSGPTGPYEAPHKIYTRLVRTFALERRDHYTIYGDGSNLIDAMYVDDAIDAIERMLTGDHWNRTLNLAGGKPVRVEDLVQAVAATLGIPSVRIDKQSVANERNEFWGAVRQTEELFGFHPKVDLAEGICRFRRFLMG